jgi:hypothetical protein
MVDREQINSLYRPVDPVISLVIFLKLVHGITHVVHDRPDIVSDSFIQLASPSTIAFLPAIVVRFSDSSLCRQSRCRRSSPGFSKRSYVSLCPKPRQLQHPLLHALLAIPQLIL